MSRLKTSSSRSAKTSTSGYDKTKRRSHKSTPRRSATGSASSAHVTSSGSSSSSTPSASSSSSSAANTVNSMKNSASSSSSSAAASSSPTSSTPTSTKECEQCGNQTLYEVGANAKAVANSKKIAAAADSGCQICDFVAFRKSQRHCVQCDKTQCEFFCEWCGHGFHAKCAKARGEHVDAVNGFCCKKCEAEQADDDDDDDANDVNAKCGECKLPFNSVADPAPAPTSAKGKNAAKNDATDHTGFKVNQSVLVENDEVLYNAVITDVDAKNERIKIHFLRWSKSFDDWYAMDDERINESLACDCCNRWFHIGCLPPIKSSGRFKDTTYVCPTCLDDAKSFYSGARSVTSSTTSSKSAKTASASASTSSGRTRKGSNADEAPVAPASKKRSSKAIVQSDSEEEEEDDDGTAQEETKAEEKDSRRTTKSKKEKEDASQSKSKKRKRSNSADSAGSTASAQEKKSKEKESTTVASPVRKSESTKSKSSSSSRTKRERSSSHDGDEKEEKKSEMSGDVVVEEKAEAKKKGTKQEETTAPIDDAKKKSEEVGKKEEPKSETAPEEKAMAPSAPAPASSPPRSSSTATVDAAASAEASLSMEKPGIKRKVSGHSVSSLLNSPSTPPRRDSPALRSLDAPVSSSTRSSNSSVSVKVEKEPAHPAQPPVKKPNTSSRSNGGGSKVWVTGRDAKTAKAAAAAAVASASPAHTTAGSSSTSTGRGSLSAFDILREVAAQSMSDDLEASTPAPAPPAPARKSQSRSKAAADRKLKADTAARATATSSKADAEKPTTNGRTPPPGQSSSTTHAPIGVGIPMNSYVDLHFAIRKEMYLRICQLEDERLLERETAQLLRSMIYPTSDKFHDLKFVYVVNKELSSLQLTKRLLELVPITAGGTAPVIPVIPMRPSLGGMGTPLQTPAPPPSLIASSCNSSPVIRRPTPEPRTPPRSASPFVLDGGSASGTPQRSFQDIKPSSSAMAISSVTSSTSTASSAASSSVAPPLLPPPLPAKLLLETMHLHSKLPTLLPPRAAPAVPTSVTTTASASASSSTPSTSTPTTTTQATSTVAPLATISPAVVATQQHADPKAPSLVNTMSASTSISSN